MKHPYYFYKPYAEKNCSRCLFDDTIATIMEDGECEYCHLHDELERYAHFDPWVATLERLKKKKGKYQVLIGISGGLDSSVLLWMAVRVWKLRVLVIHFDNNYNTDQAEHNMNRLVTVLGVDMIRYRVNQREYDGINGAFLRSGTPDCDIPNDLAMAKLMYITARKYGIKAILNGHDFRTEGSTPRLWTRMDSVYLESVNGEKTHNFPLYTVWDQIWQGLLGIRQYRPLHDMMVHLSRGVHESAMKAAVDWQDYGGKHCENLYTAFIGGHVLPTFFGIDKRVVYLSARVRSGLLKMEDARKELAAAPAVVIPKGWDDIFPMQIRSRYHYKLTDFRKYKVWFWLLLQMNIVPLTFYRKYCKSK